MAMLTITATVVTMMRRANGLPSSLGAAGQPLSGSLSFVSRFVF